MQYLPLLSCVLCGVCFAVNNVDHCAGAFAIQLLKFNRLGASLLKILINYVGSLGTPMMFLGQFDLGHVYLT